MQRKKIIDFDAYRAFFNAEALWDKIKSAGRKAGIKVVYAALVLYYLTRDSAVPHSVKLLIYGALGYFILPVDMIPDAVLALGFTDDFAAMAWALYQASRYVTPDIEARAEAKLREWFGDFDRSEVAGLLPEHCEQSEP